LLGWHPRHTAFTDNPELHYRAWKAPERLGGPSAGPPSPAAAGTGRTAEDASVRGAPPLPASGRSRARSSTDAAGVAYRAVRDVYMMSAPSVGEEGRARCHLHYSAPARRR
ncbi:hypothetical protein, partial [Streptomyces minutiscleroticus]|uniref:hypothetical protein n=1 Tax=Streptomyces minutiscleroticus TaxID=68238 RepID=UPI00332F0898